MICHGRRGLFDEVALSERGFVLLVDGRRGARLDPALAAGAADLGIIVRRLLERPGALGDVQDLDRVFGAWFDAAGCAAVLWRPDFYVFGTAATVAEIAALLANARTWLQPAALNTVSGDGSE